MEQNLPNLKTTHPILRGFKKLLKDKDYYFSSENFKIKVVFCKTKTNNDKTVFYIITIMYTFTIC